MTHFIQSFVESVDEEAINMIDEFSQERWIRNSGKSMPFFNLTESFQTFQHLLGGYAKYQIENKSNPNASPQGAILESMTTKIQDGKTLFAEKSLPYTEIPNTIKAYVNGLQDIQSTLDRAQGMMMEEGVNQEAIGDLHTICKTYAENVEKRFNPMIQKILRECGYAYKHRKRNAEQKNSHVFL